MKELILALVLAQAADLTTTAVGLSRGCTEWNPLLRHHRPSTVFAVKTSGTVGLVVMLPLFHKRHPKMTKTVAWVGIVSGLAAASWNVAILPKC